MLGHLHATLLDDSRVKISLWLAYPDLLVPGSKLMIGVGAPTRIEEVVCSCCSSAAVLLTQ